MQQTIFPVPCETSKIGSYAQGFRYCFESSKRRKRNRKSAGICTDKSGIPIVGEIPRSDEIIRWEDQGKTVIEGDAKSAISRRFFDLAEMLLKAEEEE